MTFLKRQIQITFDIGDDQFSSGSNTLVLTGARCSASINNANGYSLGELALRVYGMNVADMNKLTNMGKLYMAARNYQVTVEAGDDVSGLTKIFTGTVYSAAINYDQPNVSFDVSSSAGFLQKLQPAATFSQADKVDVIQAIESMKPDGFTVVNNQNISIQIARPYYSGSAVNQIRSLCRDVSINCDIRNNTIYVWPIGGSVDNDPVDINPDNGLVGYPVYQSTGIIATTLFNPNLVNGKVVNMTSDAVGVTGQWYALVVNHNISSEMPGGPWFTEAHLVPPGLYPNGQ